MFTQCEKRDLQDFFLNHSNVNLGANTWWRSFVYPSVLKPHTVPSICTIIYKKFGEPYIQIILNIKDLFSFKMAVGWVGREGKLSNKDKPLPERIVYRLNIS